MEHPVIVTLVLKIVAIIAIVLIVAMVVKGLRLQNKSTLISKIERSAKPKLIEGAENSEILQCLEPIDDHRISEKINKLARGASSPSLLKLSASTLPRHLIDSAAYLNMGQLYRLDKQFIGTQMNYGPGIGSSVVGADGKIIGHNSFMLQGVPWGLFLYQAGSIIFSAAHLAEISQSLKQINKKLDDLSYRFNFRTYSSSYGNYLLLQEISAYLQDYLNLTDIHRTQLALIGKDLAADKIYYSQMARRIEKIKNNTGSGLREYVDQQSETLFMDVHGLYITYYSSILYALLIGSEDAPKKIEEYNQTAASYEELKHHIRSNEFETLFLSDNFFARMGDFLGGSLAALGKKSSSKEMKKQVLAYFRESLPDMPPITKNIPPKPEIYLIKDSNDDFIIYTPTERNPIE